MRELDSGNFRVSNSLRSSFGINAHFIMNGASAPLTAELGGHVESITRKVTATPTIFFRIKLKEKSLALLDKRAVVLTSVAGAAEANDLTVQSFYRTGLVDDGGETFVPGQMIDIVVRNGGTAVDTDNIEVSCWIVGDSAPAIGS